MTHLSRFSEELIKLLDDSDAHYQRHYAAQQPQSETECLTRVVSESVVAEPAKLIIFCVKTDIFSLIMVLSVANSLSREW